ncbi:hypothetical protein [Psychrobacillus sp. FSL K6-1415]|uniref:hypothetical protein n=1 Tax=Psychrobacillus sp. FSL K6-1415 TaxID=2921544 RepID=UPI0030F91545
MCFSTNVIERQALTISEQIIKNSIYKPVSLDIIGEKNIEIQDFIMKGNGEEISLITRVNLEINEGLQLSVEPNENGLKYAMGKISYKEYKKMQNQESRKFIWYFFAISGAFLLISWASIRWFFI